MDESPPAPRASLWASLRHAAIERMGDAEVRWRSLGMLFGAGGALALLTLAVPVAPGTERAAIAVLCGLAFASAAGMVAGARRLPRGDIWVSLMLGFGTVLISLGVYFSHAPASPYALLYVLVGFEGFFFL